MQATKIITLLTDFGDGDGFVGVMKGVILSINPQATIVDITHHVPRHNINAGAFILGNSYKFFPPGTIHVSVIDPGVGSTRKAIFVQTEKYFFVAPDNRVLKYIFHYEKRFTVHEILNDSYFLKKVSNTFHGRDIFAPCAAHLSLGVRIEKFGPQINNFERGRVFSPNVTKNHIEGQIVYTDKFGNLITNIHQSLVQRHSFQITLGNYVINSLSNSYSEGKNLLPIALIGSSGFLEIALFKQSARDILGFKEKDKLRVDLLKQVEKILI